MENFISKPSENAKQKVLRDLSDLFRDEIKADVKFKVEDIIFKAHKYILEARLSYFKVMFSENYSEKDRNVIELKDIRADTFETVLAFTYGVIPAFETMDVERIIDIFQVSNYFLYEELEELASEFLATVIDCKNVLQMSELASFYSHVKLINACNMFISSHALELLKSKYCLHLSPKAFEEFISLDYLYAPEIKIFHAVQRWLEVNPDADSKQEIIDQVRLDRISSRDMVEIKQSKLFAVDLVKQSRLLSQRGNSPRGRLVVNSNLFDNSLHKTKLYSVGSSKFTKHFEWCKIGGAIMIQLVISLRDFYLVNTILLETRPGDERVFKCFCSDEYSHLHDVKHEELTDMECVSVNKYRLNFPAKAMKYIGIIAPHEKTVATCDFMNINILYADVQEARQWFWWKYMLFYMFTFYVKIKVNKLNWSNLCFNK